MPPIAPCFAHAAPLLRPSPTARLQPRLRVVRVAPARGVVWLGLVEPEKEEVSVPEAPIDAPVPGKTVLNDIRLAEQRTALKAYTEELKRKRFEEEREASRLFGWVDYAEVCTFASYLPFLRVQPWESLTVSNPCFGLSWPCLLPVDSQWTSSNVFHCDRVVDRVLDGLHYPGAD